jgi:endonuclease YncB( thermonuclease family)
MSKMYKFGILGLILLSLLLVSCGTDDVPPPPEPIEVYVDEVSVASEISQFLENHLSPIVMGLRDINTQESDDGYRITVSFQQPVTENEFNDVIVLTASYASDYFDENELQFKSLEIQLFDTSGEPLLTFNTTDLERGVLVNFSSDDVYIINLFEANEIVVDNPIDDISNKNDDEGAVDFINVDSIPIPASAPIPQGLTEAVVSRIIDGDTLEISTGERVRLIGVDAPERNDPGGSDATSFVSNLVLNKTVWLESDGNNTDRYERLRRYVWIEIPTDTGDSEQIQKYQLNALLLLNGLAEVMIVGNVRNESLFNSIAKPLASTQEAQQSELQETPQDSSSGTFIGHRTSAIFHKQTCRTLPAERNRVYFETQQAAIDAGFRACRNCRP